MQSTSSTQMNLRRLAARAFEAVRESWWYLEHLVKRTSYADYYAGRMNRIIARNPDWGLNLNKRFQLEYLCAHGMTPGSKLLDYGCGALAAGLLFIEYLDGGCYTGVDISEDVLSEGRRRIARTGLSGKAVNLIHLNSLDLTPLQPGPFDFIWAQSVFTHMPPEDIEAVLVQLRHCMTAKSVFFASFARGDQSVQQRRYKDWYYHQDFFQEAASKAGLVARIMDDWVHPDDPDGNDRLVCFRLAA